MIINPNPFTPEHYQHHAIGLTAAAEIWPIEIQNQQAVPIRSLAFWPVDGRPHPVYVCGGVSSDLADGQPD